jgi:ubiquinone/menaquinone biosynthesis C-methylase UbiE
MNANDYKELVKVGYNDLAPKYLEDRLRESADILVLNELIHRLPPQATVLDAGCGSGIPVTKLLSEHFEVVGIDFAIGQLRLAHRLVPQAKLICGDICALPFPAATVDAICSYYALIHIPRHEHRAILSSFHRLLRPNGMIFLCMGVNDVAHDIDSFLGTPMYWSHFDAQTNMEMITEEGFKILWDGRVADDTCPGSSHLFVLAQNSG